MPDILIKGARVVDPFQGWDEVLDVLISKGRVCEVGRDLIDRGQEVVEGYGKVLAPGFLDLHVHLREPGNEDAETLKTGLSSAIKGGFTAVCCMPNTKPPLDNAALVEGLRRSARSLGLADLFPLGCISRGREGEELADMALMRHSEAEVRAFSDDGDGVADAGLMRRALEYATAMDAVIVCHPEDRDLSAGGQVNEGEISYAMGLRGIPAVAEEAMVARDLLLCEETGGRLHLAHVSTESSLRMIREAKARGVPVTAEVTPHHIALSERDIPGYDTNYKVNPPLRRPEDVAALRRGLSDGTIDAVATDHAPHTREDKEKEFDYAPFGVVGMESAFPVLYTELVTGGIIDLNRLLELLTSGPASVLGLSPREYGGGIREGSRADLVLLDLEDDWVLDAHDFASLGRNCPFHGKTVKGRVLYTLKNGKPRYDLMGR